MKVKSALKAHLDKFIIIHNYYRALRQEYDHVLLVFAYMNIILYLDTH